MMQWASLPVDQPRKEPTPNNPYPYCLCGCGAENNPGSRFNQGHDKKLESALEQVKSGEKAPPGVLIEAARNCPEFEVIGYTAEEILSIAGTWVMKNCKIWWTSLPEPPEARVYPRPALVVQYIGGLPPEAMTAVDGGLRRALGL